MTVCLSFLYLLQEQFRTAGENARSAFPAGIWGEQMAIIEVQNLSKTFVTRDARVEALRNINFSVEERDIYGIIGMSGAGKSTLVRCLNYLETPTEGTVTVEGRTLGELSTKELRELRGSISMIFQGFNLLMQRTVLDNVCFPLTLQQKKLSRAEARKKAEKLLEIVGLSEKARAYPAQLSGGQKQRVAIARALASDPKILLCDEATSALDPQTTQSILQLLRKINEETGITIVIITHQMSVVREICRHVAIVENGEIVENGPVEEIFTHPKSRAARQLIIEGKDPDEWAREQESRREGLHTAEVKELHAGHTVRIVYSTNSSYEPVIANMILETGHPVNILKADTKDVGGVARGEMILGLDEEPQIAAQQIAYLKERGLAVEELTDLHTGGER